MSPVRVLFAWLCLLSTSWAAATIEFQLTTDRDFAPTEVQKWYTTLTELKVDGLNIRGGNGSEKPEVVVRGSKTQPVYEVHGVLSARGLLVPGGRFTLQDRAGMSRWLEELRAWGPQGAPTGKPLYGLNGEQWAKLEADLAQPLDMVTLGVARKHILQQLDKLLATEVVMDRATLALFTDDDKMPVECKGLSAGAALAYVLRPHGMTFKPERLASGAVRLVVLPAKQNSEPWPIGRPLDKRPVEVMPQMLEFLEVEIEPTPLSDVLAALEPRLKVPVLIDENSLVKHDVDITQVKVSFAKKRVWYEKLLRSILQQAALKFEIRVDEAGQPFLWISSFKP